MDSPQDDLTRRARLDERRARSATRQARVMLITAVVLLGVGVLVIAGAAVGIRLLAHDDDAPQPAPATPSAAATTPAPAAPAASVEPTAEPEPLAVVNDFDAAEAMAHVREITALGVRKGGSEAEKQAAEYVSRKLKAMGYEPDTRAFRLPNGLTSRNVVAVLPGTTDRILVLGAHLDSKPPAPGGNDNASGVGAVLAMAKELRDENVAPTVEFVFFGSEEMIDANADHHHYGSRKYVAMMTSEARSRTAGMISVDMIGYGTQLTVRTMPVGPQTLKDALIRAGRSHGPATYYLKDSSTYGWSDHEPFAKAGIPAAWLEWRDDPYYHKATDTAAHVSKAKVAAAGGLILDYVRSLDAASLDALRGR